MNISLKKVLAAGVISSALLTGALAAEEKSSSALNNVVVVIDGVKLTRADLEQKQGSGLFQARNTYYQAERKAIEDYVETYILERQAKKENVTVEELLKKHVDSLVAADPSDDALRVYYEGLDTSEGFDTAKDKIRDYIRQRRAAKLKADFLKSLHDQTKVEVTLAPPRAEASLKGVAIRGPQNAPVTVIEFADFECPYCQQMEPKLVKLQQEFQGKLAFAYKDLPLPMHSHAQKAAEASHCAQAQGKFWEYHDLLYSSQRLEVAQLKESARTLKLDGEAFDKCLDSNSMADAVAANMQEAQGLSIPGTPGFFINGRYLEGNVPYEGLKRMVEEELSRNSTKATETAKR